MVTLGSAAKLHKQHKNRTKAAQVLDESQTHAISVSLKDDHPLAVANIRKWKKDPGALDIVEIDGEETPKSMMQFKSLHVGKNKKKAFNLKDPGQYVAMHIDPPMDASGKSQVSKANIDKLVKAANVGPTALMVVSDEISEGLKSAHKKLAIKFVVTHLMQQIDIHGVYQTTDNVSEQPETIAKVASGEIKPTPQKKLTSTQTQKNHDNWAKGKDADWDKVLKKQSGKKGSNEGGLYLNTESQTYHYIKWPSDPNQARMEHLANQLYHLAGVPVPDTRLITFGGKTAIMSDWLSEANPMTTTEMKKSPDVLNGYVADAWLANWDVIGLSADNIVKGPGGVAYRIDPGGSLLYRASGKVKPLEKFGKEVDELQTLQQQHVNPQATSVFGDITKADMKKMAGGVTDITDAQIDEAVDQAGIPHQKGPNGQPNLNEYMKLILKARRDYIVENILSYTPPTPMTADDLAEVSNLDKKTLEEIAENSDKLMKKKYGAFNKSTFALRKKIVKLALEEALGDKDDPELVNELLSKYWLSWKGTPVTNMGNLLRWAAGSNEISEDAAVKRLEKFWQFQVDKGKMTAEQRDKFKAALAKNIKKDGTHLRNGLTVSKNANSALLHTHYNQNTTTPSGKKKKLKTHIKVYRGWHADQVEEMGLKPKVGDEIDFREPTMHSWSLSKGSAFKAGHGGMFTEALIPINTIQLSDRLNNYSGKYQGEDEIVFCCPQIEMKVTSAP